jgi:TonB-linked SusC/RagA family outer membrane protein
MKKKRNNRKDRLWSDFSKTCRIMKLMCLFLLVVLMQVSASIYSQNTKLSLTGRNLTIEQVLGRIEDQSQFSFFYNVNEVDLSKVVNVDMENVSIESILNYVLDGTGLAYTINNKLIIIHPSAQKGMDHFSATQQNRTVKGKVTDSSGAPLPGVTVVVKETTIGTVTGVDGNYSLNNIPADATLVFSFVGMKKEEVNVEGRITVDVKMEEETIGLEEVVAVGYGTMKKSDLTGSVIRANVESFREQPNLSIMQSLQGSVPGLNVGQVTQAGEEPGFSIRGRTTISGETVPLIIVDGVIFRGNIIDLNPNDIETIDILKDASSTAVYGSQAANGVIIISTKQTGGKEGKPVIRLSSQYSFQRPYKTFDYPDADYWIEKTERSDFYQSRTAGSGYLEKNPDYTFTSRFETAEEFRAYNEGILTNWHDLVTRDNIHTQSHNISVGNQTKSSNYFISLGYSDQVGYMLNEDYKRINARINIDNKITNWFTFGIQSFWSSSDYSGNEVSPRFRYEHNPFMTVYDANGDYVTYPGSQFLNPLLTAKDDNLDKRINFSGNIYANIDIPFVKGLSYKVNFSNNRINTSNYGFSEVGANLRGSGYKSEAINNDWTADHIVTYSRKFNDMHHVNATLVYGMEERNYNNTYAGASDFINPVLGYNRLQAGNTDLYEVSSGAWEESSLYQMARLFYGYRDKYLLTGTIRRDGFSGFSKEHKFGIFPSVAFGWVASQEPFARTWEWLDNLKLRVSYGANGNRTIARYQTLAVVEGGYNYITGDKKSIYTQSISSLASSELKWETTKGINVGLDFGILGNRLFGAIDYYNNNTFDLLYNVDVPSISRYSTFPDNLGKIHNHGIDLSLSGMVIKKNNFSWLSTLAFSSNRNELKELLGFDNDGDGKEDDLVSEGLFIGKSLSSVYTYEITGEFWQVGETLPSGFALGSYKIKDLNDDGEYTPDKDRRIIGYSDPAYRFSLNNELKYKNWTLKVFINSVQGGKNHYLGLDDLSNWGLSESVFRRNLPREIDFWSPDNPNARYQAIPLTAHFGDRYTRRNFIRLQDVSLSYDFSREVLRNSFIQNLTLYMSGKNLATWTNWPGWDPETGEGVTRDGRPVLTSFTFGIDVEF